MTIRLSNEMQIAQSRAHEDAAEKNKEKESALPDVASAEKRHHEATKMAYKQHGEESWGNRTKGHGAKRSDAIDEPEVTDADEDAEGAAARAELRQADAVKNAYKSVPDSASGSRVAGDHTGAGPGHRSRKS
jgi:hypothetical protein